MIIHLLMKNRSYVYDVMIKSCYYVLFKNIDVLKRNLCKSVSWNQKLYWSLVTNSYKTKYSTDFRIDNFLAMYGNFCLCIWIKPFKSFFLYQLVFEIVKVGKITDTRWNSWRSSIFLKTLFTISFNLLLKTFPSNNFFPINFLFINF